MALKKNPKIEEVKNYYEHFVNYRVNREGNARVKDLLKFIDKEVVGKNYQSALDVGCGAGITTEHLFKYIPNVLGVDLSDERINVARSHGKAKYKQLDYSDKATGEKYDLVCVFDCLEHILPERRNKFLQNVYDSFTDKVLVSIPEPNNLEHLRKTRPHILQIVDECIWDEDLSLFTITNKWTKGIYTYYILTK